jgi:hypothetical protein
MLRDVELQRWVVEVRKHIRIPVSRLAYRQATLIFGATYILKERVLTMDITEIDYYISQSRLKSMF